MIRKSVAGALALVLSSPALLSNAPAPMPQFVFYPLVHQVLCQGAAGTAFRIGRNTFASVDHVTNRAGCTIHGAPMDAKADPGLDFSVAQVPISRGGAMKISCDGFKAGEHVYAVGYAGGRPVQRLIVLTATGQFADNGMAILRGDPTVIPGMSGGPILSASGEVVGTVNMYHQLMPISLSREMRDTSLCKEGHL